MGLLALAQLLCLFMLIFYFSNSFFSTQIEPYLDGGNVHMTDFHELNHAATVTASIALSALLFVSFYFACLRRFVEEQYGSRTLLSIFNIAVSAIGIASCAASWAFYVALARSTPHVPWDATLIVHTYNGVINTDSFTVATSIQDNANHAAMLAFAATLLNLGQALWGHIKLPRRSEHSTASPPVYKSDYEQVHGGEYAGRQGELNGNAVYIIKT